MGAGPLGHDLGLGPNFPTFTGSGQRPRSDVSVGGGRLDHPDLAPSPATPAFSCLPWLSVPSGTML